MKTYSRRDRARTNDQDGSEPPTKRRRISVAADGRRETNNLSSSPNSSKAEKSSAQRSAYLLDSSPSRDKLAASSDVPSPQSTPPSSPPALKCEDAPHLSPGAKTSGVLSETTSNPRRFPKPKSVAKKRYTQLQIDLGQSITRHCKTCGMDYVTSNAEDVALHQKYHALNIGGVDVGKTFADSESVRKYKVWSGQTLSGPESCVVAIGRKAEKMLRNKVRRALDVATRELGAVEITDEELWSCITPENTPEHCHVDRYKAFLYVRSGKCVGLCLVEQVFKAHTVLSPGKMGPGWNITLSEDESSVSLGVSRIWTSNALRKQGIATRLLECARRNFWYGLSVQKEEVAFSQPTDSGGLLAQSWFGHAAGWHVYVDKT